MIENLQWKKVTKPLRSKNYINLNNYHIKIVFKKAIQKIRWNQ